MIFGDFLDSVNPFSMGGGGDNSVISPSTRTGDQRTQTTFGDTYFNAPPMVRAVPKKIYAGTPEFNGIITDRGNDPLPQTIGGIQSGHLIIMGFLLVFFIFLVRKL